MGDTISALKSWGEGVGEAFQPGKSHEVMRDFGRAGASLVDGMTLGLDGGAMRKYTDSKLAGTSPEQAFQKWNSTIMGGGIRITPAGQTSISTTHNSYGAGVGNSTTPPSQLMKISDPTTRQLVSQTRGKARQVLKSAGSALDGQSASILAGSNAAQPSRISSNLSSPPDATAPVDDKTAGAATAGAGALNPTIN